MIDIFIIGSIFTPYIPSHPLMKNALVPIATKEELVVPPVREPSARAYILHLEELQRAMVNVPSEHPNLPSIIRQVHDRADALTWRISVDAKAALSRVSAEGLPVAEQLVLELLTVFHQRADELFRVLNGKVCAIPASIDTKRLREDLGVFLGVIKPKSAGEVKTEKIGGRGSIYFDSLTTGPMQPESTPESRFVTALNDIDCQMLLLDILSVDERKDRRKFVDMLVAEVEKRFGAAGKLADVDRKNLIDKVTTFLSRLRANDLPNPYHLAVSNHLLAGLLPETFDLNPAKPGDSLKRWRTVDRGAHSARPAKVKDYIPHFQCHQERRQILNGGLVVYGGTGGYQEIDVAGAKDVNELLQENLNATFDGSKPEKSVVGMRFYSRQELEEALLALPVGRAHQIPVQLRGTSMTCFMYRDDRGELVIEDEHEQPPARLRMTGATHEQIIADPFKYFSLITPPAEEIETERE